jgi:hypothetical protein
MRRSRQKRNAASVFPLPVGESMSAESPRAIAGQPAVCGRVGASNALLNHARTAGWNGSSGSVFERAVTRGSYNVKVLAGEISPIRTKGHHG